MHHGDFAAGVNARSMADVKLFNSIFSDCEKDYKDVSLGSLRIGFPKNFWEDLGEEVGCHLYVLSA